MKNLNFSKELAFVLVLAVLLGASGGAISGYVVASQQQQKLAQLNKKTEIRVSSESEAMIKAISEVKPAVVSIIATKDLQIVNTLPFNFFFLVNRSLATNKLSQKLDAKKLGVVVGLL